MRQLANLVGNEVMKSVSRWPRTGEARDIKALTERITRRLDGQQPTRDLDLAFGLLLQAAEDFDEILSNSYFHSYLALTPVKRANTRETDTLQSLVELVVQDARFYIEKYYESLPPPPTPLEVTANEVGTITPEQKIGPLRFATVDGVIRIEHQPANVSSRDIDSVHSARAELISAGNSSAEFLRSANFDRRLTQEVKQIVDRLTNAQDVIALGVAAISFQQIVEGFKEELPTFWFAKLQGFCLGLSMYVAQFPEWMRFAENAAEAEYSREDVSRLYVAGQALNEQLKAHGDVVDPEVPRSLAFLLEAVRDPHRALKRTVFATIRSIENLLSAVFKSFVTSISGMPEAAKKGVSSATTIIVGSSLLVAAATAAIHVDPAAGRVLRTSWLGKVGKLVLENVKGE